MNAIASMLRQAGRQAGRQASRQAGRQAGRQDKSALFWRFREYEATVQGPQRAFAGWLLFV